MAGFADRSDVRAPRAAIEVDRKQPARVLGEQRIDTHHLPALQVLEQLALRWYAERLVGTLPALHARLAADACLPLVIAARCPAAATLRRFLPTAREHVLAPPEQAGEQRELALWRPRSGLDPYIYDDFGRDCLLPPSAKLDELAGCRLALPVERLQPLLRSRDRNVEISVHGHRPILHPKAASAHSADHCRATESEATMRASRCKTTTRRRVERGIYRQPNGRYAVCFMVAGKPRFRTIGDDLDAARAARTSLIEAARRGEVPVAPNLRFGTLADHWIARYEQLVAVEQRRARTLEGHRYHLDRHLRPRLDRRRVSAITVEDVSRLIADMQEAGHSEKTTAGAVATLHSVLRLARRRGWIVDDPVAKLEAGERPRPERRRQRVLGRDEIRRLLAVCPSSGLPLLITALYTGMRISELLGLTWQDVDFDEGVIHVRVQLSRAHRGIPSRRVAPKTRAAVREIPLSPQLAEILLEHRRTLPQPSAEAWVFPSRTGTPFGHRNAQRRVLSRAATRAGLEGGGWPRLRFHDPRHTFASHLIIDLGLDVAQVSTILGHASATITLDVYTHLFDQARHAGEVRAKMAASAFAALIEPARAQAGGADIMALPMRGHAGDAYLTARERAALRWAT